MKTIKTVVNRFHERRETALRRIAAIGPFVEGSVCQVKRPGCAKPGCHLTFKKRGKTCTVYIPLELAAEVKTWAREYRRLRKLIRTVTTQALGLIRGHAANRAAGTRARASSPTRARRNLPRS